MEKRHYSRRAGSARRYSTRHKRNTQSSHFFIKANICLGVVICVLAAASMENEQVADGCNKLAKLITTSSDRVDIANGLEAIKEGREGIYTFAGEKENIRLSDDIKAEIEQRSNVYQRNNKGAPQMNGQLQFAE